MHASFAEVASDDSDFEMEDTHPTILYWRERLFPEEHYNILKERIPKFQVLSPHADYFGALGMCVVLANLVTLAMYDPFDDNSEKSRVLDKLDIAFLSFFGVEILLKLVFLQPRVMFANGWNTLDVLIVVSSVIAEFLQSFLPQLSSVSGLRAVRVLRPLRAIGKIPEVRVVVNAMLRSLRHIVDVGILFFLFLVAFATGGLVQYKGKLRFRCVRDEVFLPGLLMTLSSGSNGSLPALIVLETGLDPVDIGALANLTLSDFVCGSKYDMLVSQLSNSTNASIACMSDMVCDTSNPSDFFVGMSCPYGYTCAEVENPSFGYIGFDNMAQALLTVQTSTTLEGWYNLLAYTVDSTSVAAIFFCLGIAVVGSFFVVNVLVAIINSEFGSVHEEERQKEIRNKLLSVRVRKTILLYGGTVEKIVERISLAVSERQQRYLQLRRIVAKERHAGGYYHMRQADFEGIVVRSVDRFRANIAYRVVETKGFVYGTAVAMVLMLVSMAIGYNNMPPDMITTLDGITNFFVAIIAVELLFRFLATDPFVFFWNLGNVVGIIVVGVSIADMSLANFSFPAIRVLRLVIAMKLIRLFPTVYRHLLIVLGSLKASGVLMAVIALHLFIVATLGMQLFGGQFCGMQAIADGGIGGKCNNRPRENFDSIGEALITAFELLCTDGWTSIMYNGMRSANSTAGTVAISVLFVVLYAIGVYILLNLFIAILINSTTEISSNNHEKSRESQLPHVAFSKLPDDSLSSKIDLLHDFGETVFGFEHADQAEEMREEKRVHDASILKKANSILGGHHQSSNKKKGAPKTADHPPPAASPPPPSLMLQGSEQEAEYDPFAEVVSEGHFAAPPPVPAAAAADDQDSGSEPGDGDGSDEDNPHALVRRPVQVEKKWTWRTFLTTGKANEDVQLSGGSRMQTFRRICRIAVGNRVTQFLLLFVVLLSTVSLIIEDPILAPDQWLSRAIQIFDYVSSSIFLLECLLKIAAHGFVQGPKSYLRRTCWNVLDFSLVLLNIVQLVLSNLGNTRGLRSTKVLYAFRPLRLVRRSKGMRLVVKSLLHSLVPIKDVVIIIGAFWILFAIAGLQFFRGTFYFCNTSNTTAVIVTRMDCAVAGGSWDDTPFNFDHIGAAMLSLFVISTLQGWETIMYYGMDAVGKDMQPQTNANPWASLYFVAFAILGGFFFVSLFVSVIIQSYEAERERLQKRHIFLTAEQEGWLESQKKIFSAVPLLALEDDDEVDDQHQTLLERARHFAFAVTSSKYFERFINLVIATSIALIAVEHYPMKTSTEDGLFYGNVAVTVIYLLEMALRIFALGPKLYWTSNWFRFDTVVALGSFVDLILGRVLSLERNYGTILRSLRIIKLIRVVDKNHRLSDVIRKFIAALYGLANVTLLLMLFVTITAMVCMRLFGHLRRDFTYITPTYNFENFGNSVMLLLSMLLGGPWPNIMTSCMCSGPPDCDPNIGDCGSVAGSTILFTAFVVFGNFVLINIFVAVIVDTFQPPKTEEVDPEKEEGGVGNSNSRGNGWGLTESEVSDFVDAWLKYDSAKTLSIAGGDLLPMLKSLPPDHPFFPPAVSDMYKIVGQFELRQDFCELRFISKLMLDEVVGRVEFFDVVIALTRVQCGVKLPEDVMSSLRKRFGRRYRVFIERARKMRLLQNAKVNSSKNSNNNNQQQNPPPAGDKLRGRSTSSSSNNADQQQQQPSAVEDNERQELLDRYAAMFLLKIWRRRRNAVLGLKKNSSSSQIIPRHIADTADDHQSILVGTPRSPASPLSPPPLSPPPPIRQLPPSSMQLRLAHRSSFSLPASARFVDVVSPKAPPPQQRRFEPGDDDDFFSPVDLKSLQRLEAEMNRLAPPSVRQQSEPLPPVTPAAAVSKYVVKVPDTDHRHLSPKGTAKSTPQQQEAPSYDPFAHISDDDDDDDDIDARLRSPVIPISSKGAYSDRRTRLRELDEFLDL